MSLLVLKFIGSSYFTTFDNGFAQADLPKRELIIAKIEKGIQEMIALKVAFARA